MEDKSIHFGLIELFLEINEFTNNVHLTNRRVAARETSRG